MSQSFPVIYICRFRRRWCGGRTSTAGQKGINGFMAASMLCEALFTAPNARIFTAGLCGITGETFYSLAVLHSCRAWIKEVRITDHSGIGFAGCDGKGNQGSIERKGCIPACFREEYQRSAGE